jgi:competence protein ComEC
VLSPEFWLSFAAVGIILFVTSGRMLQGKFISTLRIQWAISLGLIPFTLLFFQAASITSPLANLVAIPVFALLVVPTTLLAVLTLPITTASDTLFKIAGGLSHLGWNWISMIDQQIPTVLQLASPGTFALVCSLIGVAIIGLPSGVPARWLGAVWCLPLLWTPARPAAETFRLTLLDVGQGLSAVVQTANHSLLFDAGARFSAEFNAGDSVILPYLRSRGISALDTVIISHGDNDHVGGYGSIEENIVVRRLVSNVPGLQRAHPCSVGTTWDWDGVRFSILHPRKKADQHNNNDSCVLRIASQWGSAMLTADIEKETEKLLVVQYGNGLASDVLVAAHHGSQTSSTNLFLETVKPRWILVPAGYRNRYRHPAKKVTQRYDQKHIPWLVSGTSGAISVTFNKMPLTPVRHRDLYKRYWHNQDFAAGSAS